MKKWLWLWLCLVLCLPAELSVHTGVVWGQETESEGKAEEDPLRLYAQSAVLEDGHTGRVLYGKGEEIIRPMASTTKIMTCILALELADPTDQVIVSEKAAAQPKVHLGVHKGQTFYLKDLLYSLMLESHNDSAVMIAEHTAGSVEQFSREMNEKAKSLGCDQSFFITPNGLDGKTVDTLGQERIHSTSARDLARIMAYCVNESPEREEFLKITGTRNYYFTDVEGKHSYNCTNHNALLDSMEGVISGKTGFTGGAGYSYVGALEDGDRSFVIALLGCGWPPHKTWKWSDARKLYEFGLEHFQNRNVYEEQKLPELPVEGAICWSEDGMQCRDSTALTLNLREEEKKVELLLSEEEKVTIRRNLPNGLMAPVQAGEQVGTVDYLLDGQLIRRFPVYAAENVRALTLREAFRHIGEMFLGQ